MEVLGFNCESCGEKVTKIKSLKDIFLIKSGRKIICENCGSEYSVPKLIGMIFSFYNYLLIGGLSVFIWLFLTVFIDDILGKEISRQLGIWAWVISAMLYVILEFIVAIILPLKQKKD